MKYNTPRYLFASLILMTMLASSCSTTKITVDTSNPNIELSDFETFDFFEIEAEGDTSGAFNQNMASLKAEVIEQLLLRRLTQDVENPDLKINLGIVVQEKTQTRQTSLGDPGEWNYIGQRNYKWESKTVEVGTFKEGSITIHLVDKASNEAVWIGMIEGVVPRKPEKRRVALEEAVASLFSKIN